MTESTPTDPTWTDPTCPACGGAWLYDYTFGHALDCAIRAAEDATQAADRSHDAPVAFTRPATDAEMQLRAAFRHDQSAADKPRTEVRWTTPTIRCRTVDGINPEALKAATERSTR